VITPRHTLRLGTCTIRLYTAEAPGEPGPRGQPTLVTTFSDEVDLAAQPGFTPADRARARRLGYGTGHAAALAMWREHDPLHTWLAVMQGRAYSETLWHAAHGTPPPRGVAPAEEERVLAFTALLRAGRVSDDLAVFAPLHLPTLAQAARVLLDPWGEV